MEYEILEYQSRCVAGILGTNDIRDMHVNRTRVYTVSQYPVHV